MRKKLFSLLLALVTCFTLVGLVACDEEVPPPAPDYGTLTIADVTVEEGKSADITATFSKSEYAGDISYSFESDAFTIANGKVTGVTPTAAPVTVTATTDNHTATFTVTVLADYGTLSLAIDGNVYVNYPGVPVTATFSRPKYEQDVSYTFSNVPAGLTLSVEDGKIVATGSIESTIDSEVNSTLVRMHATTGIDDLRKNVNVTIKQYNGANASGNLLNFETRIANYISANEDYSGVEGGEKGGTLFVGDSFFDGFWADASFRSAYDMKNAYRWGVSSSTVADWLIVSERLVIPMQPKNIVVHLGTNDYFDDHKTADQIIDMLERLFNRYHEALPEANVYWFNIEPRKNSDGTKREDGGVPDAVNAEIKTFAEGKDWLTYIDSAAWCFTDDTRTTIKTSFFKSGDNVHPAPESYQLYVDALNDAGIVIEGTHATTVTTIADYNCTVLDSIGNTNKVFYYRARPLTTEYVFSGTITINEVGIANNVPNNPHIQLWLSPSNRFLLWDKNKDWTFGVGWQENSNNYKGEEDTGCSKFTFTAGTPLSIPFKLVVTKTNAYWYLNNKLEAVALNVPNLAENGLKIGGEKIKFSVTGISAEIKSDDGNAYETAIAATEIATTEAGSVVSGVTLRQYVPAGTVYKKYVANMMGESIDVSNDFIIPGKKNSGSYCTGSIRDWVYSVDGKTRFTGNLAFTYEVQLLDGNNNPLTKIDQYSNNCFYINSAVENQTQVNRGTWSDANSHHVLYWKLGNNTSAKITYRTGNSLGTGFTATSFKSTIVRKDNKLYVANSVGTTHCVQEVTLTDGSALTMWLGGEDWNYRITNLKLSTEAADITAALTAIGK